MLALMSLCVSFLAFLWVMRYRFWGYYVKEVNADGEPTGKQLLKLGRGYWRARYLPRIGGWALGAYMTYAAVYLGWNGWGDPLTLILLFLGGAVGMALLRIRWAWLAAPLISGYGITQLWGILTADPAWQITLGATLAFSIPTFVLLLYLEQAHITFGEILVTTRLAVALAVLFMVQAVALWAGVSLWVYVQAGLDNIFLKVITLLGGII
jgi:hypothetical protein